MPNNPENNRLSRIGTALSVIVLFAFFAWLSFSLLSMMINPDLTGNDYWKAIGGRAKSNPSIVIFLLGSLIGVLIGCGLLCRALMKQKEDASLREPQRHVTNDDS